MKFTQIVHDNKNKTIAITMESDGPIPIKHTVIYDRNTSGGIIESELQSAEREFDKLYKAVFAVSNK